MRKPVPTPSSARCSTGGAFMDTTPLCVFVTKVTASNRIVFGDLRRLQRDVLPTSPTTVAGSFEGEVCRSAARAASRRYRGRARMDWVERRVRMARTRPDDAADDPA